MWLVRSLANHNAIRDLTSVLTTYQPFGQALALQPSEETARIRYLQCHARARIHRSLPATLCGSGSRNTFRG